MKQAYIQTKDKAEHSIEPEEHNETEYASDRMESGTKRMTEETVHQTKKAVNKVAENVKDKVERKIEDRVKKKVESKAENTAKDTVKNSAERASKNAAKKSAEKSIRATNSAGRKSIRTVEKTSAKTVKQSARSTGKATVKTAQKGTAQQVWTYLKSYGYSDSVAAGIIGNMMRECGGDTLNLDWNIIGHYNGDEFYGLCQWCLRYTPSGFFGSIWLIGSTIFFASRKASTIDKISAIRITMQSISVPEMRRILGLGKTESYWLIKKGYFKTIMLFGKMRVMVDSFEEWYANQFHYKKVDGTPPGQNWRHTMSIHETADILGIAPTTVYSLIDKELFIVLTVSGKKRIDKKSFEEWYANQSKYHRHDKEVIADV